MEKSDWVEFKQLLLEDRKTNQDHFKQIDKQLSSLVQTMADWTGQDRERKRFENLILTVGGGTMGAIVTAALSYFLHR